MKALVLGLGFMLTACTSQVDHPVVVLETTSGPIEITVYPDKAPISTGDFLRYVDAGHYDGQGFYRVVHEGNDPRDMGMSLIQGGRLDSEMIGDPIEHELTTYTGMSNAHGTVSIARDAPGTGSAAYFFINIGNNDFLDTGGTRNTDLQGYATFGRVTDGLDIARKIQKMDTSVESDAAATLGQILTNPVIITRAYRK